MDLCNGGLPPGYGSCTNLLTSMKLFKCTVCGKKFKRRFDLGRHLKIHSRPFKCSLCTKTFSKVADFKRHLRNHTRVKSFQCKVCTKSFRFKSFLRKHLQTHNIEVKMFACPVCNQNYRCKSSLMTHLRIHVRTNSGVKSLDNTGYNELSDEANVLVCDPVGYKPVNCPLCKKSFRLRRALKDHFKMHTGILEISDNTTWESVLDSSSQVIYDCDRDVICLN